MVLTGEQMRECERRAQEGGITEQVLMENAGQAAAEWISGREDLREKRIMVFCGSGNNGGDGFVIARRLSEMAAGVTVVLVQGAPRTPQARQALARLGEVQVSVLVFQKDIETFAKEVRQADVMVDAVFGIGFHGDLQEAQLDVCRIMNASRATVYAVDIPSGVDADTGEKAEGAVQADATAAMHCLKPAHVMMQTREFCGQTLVLEIGIPGECAQDMPRLFRLIEEEMVWGILPPRERDSNKGTYGRLLNFSGCLSLSGAAYMSTLAASRTGAGLVTLATTKTLVTAFAGKLTGATFLPLEETRSGAADAAAAAKLLAQLEKSTACLMGCGLSVEESTIHLVRQVIRSARCPLVLDADGLNVAAKDIDMLKGARAGLVLTPHVGEMARLCGRTIQQIKAAPYAAAQKLAREQNAVVVLKDAVTVIATPEGELLTNTTGNPGLAKGGSGDILAGMIAGFLAQGFSPRDSAVSGVYLHGLAADRCASRKSQYAMQPMELLEDLAQIFVENGR